MAQEENPTPTMNLPPINMEESSTTNTTQNMEIEKQANNTNVQSTTNTTTDTTPNRAALQSQNVIDNQTTITAEQQQQTHTYGPVTSSELLPVTMALQLMYTTTKIPDVLEMPTKFITNMTQYQASIANTGPKCAPQIPPYHANRLVHHILGPIHLNQVMNICINGFLNVLILIQLNLIIW